MYVVSVLMILLAFVLAICHPFQRDFSFASHAFLLFAPLASLPPLAKWRPRQMPRFSQAMHMTHHRTYMQICQNMYRVSTLVTAEYTICIYNMLYLPFYHIHSWLYRLHSLFTETTTNTKKHFQSSLLLLNMKTIPIANTHTHTHPERTYPFEHNNL